MAKEIKRIQSGGDEFRFVTTNDFRMVEMFEVAFLINSEGIPYLREFMDEQETMELVHDLMERTGLTREELVVEDEAGTYAGDGKCGVWYHEELAEAFVRWHQPEYAEDWVGHIKWLGERALVLNED